MKKFLNLFSKKPISNRTLRFDVTLVRCDEGPVFRVETSKGCFHSIRYTASVSSICNQFESALFSEIYDNPVF